MLKALALRSLSSSTQGKHFHNDSDAGWYILNGVLSETFDSFLLVAVIDFVYFAFNI